MIVAGPDGFVKGQYRKWNIKTAATDDDYAMMREVFQRRFARAQDEDPDRDGGMWPDLVLIDGGKGQMSAATLHWHWGSTLTPARSPTGRWPSSSAPPLWSR